MNVLEKAKAHFQEQLSNEPKSIEVPEWECTIYYKPMSLKTKGELNKYAENPFEYAARSLILRSLTDSGEKMFRGANYTEIMRQVDPAVVERVILAMATDDDPEDIEKN